MGTLPVWTPVLRAGVPEGPALKVPLELSEEVAEGALRSRCPRRYTSEQLQGGMSHARRAIG